MKLWAVALVFAAPLAQASKYSYLPDPVLTPGVVATTNRALVCKKDYPSKARYVTTTTKNKVYKAYKVNKTQCKNGCKIDHLIPIAIGGSNDPKNLWPHEYGATWNIFAKTRLEIRLRKEVCAGRLPIVEAQTCIQKNWTRCYDRFYNIEGEGHEDHQPTK